MADTAGKGYKAFVAAHKRIVKNLEARKGMKTHYNAPDVPKHDYKPAQMADTITNVGKRYFNILRCECGHFVHRGDMTYDRDESVPVYRFAKVPEDNGCTLKKAS